MTTRLVRLEAVDELDREVAEIGGAERQFGSGGVPVSRPVDGDDASARGQRVVHRRVVAAVVEVRVQQEQRRPGAVLGCRVRVGDRAAGGRHCGHQRSFH